MYLSSILNMSPSEVEWGWRIPRTKQESCEPSNGLYTTPLKTVQDVDNANSDPLKTVEDGKKCGDENRQCYKDPGDVETPVRQHWITQGPPLSVVIFIFVWLVRFRNRLAEEVDHYQDWWEYNETAEETAADLLRGYSNRSDCHGFWIYSLFICGPEEHAVGDHGEEQRGHASGKTLRSSERRRLCSHADRQPYMIVDGSVKHVATH